MNSLLCLQYKLQFLGILQLFRKWNTSLCSELSFWLLYMCIKKKTQQEWNVWQAINDDKCVFKNDVSDLI